MGVTYKLRDEVVHFIISQRQSNPLFSCRQLAESASEKFGLHLSKSSVHDVLKESGIVTPRGRKPKDKFKIPQEKKRQIQSSLSQIKLLAPPIELIPSVIASEAKVLVSDTRSSSQSFKEIATSPTAPRNDTIEYEGAGKIFLKAALWDLGIFSEENIKETDWAYYLTYSKGVKIVLENNKSIFIDLCLPLERCIREVADGVINNIRPFMVHKVSDEGLLKSCMDAQSGAKITNVSIVDSLGHILLEFDNIVEFKRTNILEKVLFVESNEKEILKRSTSLFFPQVTDNHAIENILNLKGFDAPTKNKNVVTILINNGYENIEILKEAVERLNGMYLRDEEGRLLKVSVSLREA